MRFLLPCLLWVLMPLLAWPQNPSGGGLLKYVIYDFDGLTTGQTDLPDGDYGNNLQYAVAPNPLEPSAVIGDRVLRIDLNGNAGSGEFGKATMRFIDLDRNADYLNFGPDR